MPKTQKYVITNVPADKQKEVIEALYPLIQKGIIKANNIHCKDEEGLGE